MGVNFQIYLDDALKCVKKEEMMSNFAKYLEKYIYQSKLTENQLAKISGFTRSYIALMKNGQRISADRVRMGKLLSALNLSPYEYDMLWEEYLKERYGDENYAVRQHIVSFIESFSYMSGIDIKSICRHEISDIKCIRNRMDLEYLLKAIIENEALKNDGSIRMIMQSDFDFIYNLLPCVCRNADGLTVDHMICLEGSNGSDYQEQIYNLDFLKKLMPSIVTKSNSQYRVYYYYDNVASHFASSAMMPYLLITSEYAVNISVDLNQALVFKDAEIIEFFRQLFEVRKRGCQPMFQRFEDGGAYIAYVQDMNKQAGDSDHVVSIGSQPCFGMLNVEPLVLKYVPENDRHSQEQLRALIKMNHKTIDKSKVAVRSYFTEEGLQRLMRDGRIDELPDELYQPLSVEDRKSLVQMLLSAISGGVVRGISFESAENTLSEGIDDIFQRNDGRQYLLYDQKSSEQTSMRHYRGASPWMKADCSVLRTPAIAGGIRKSRRSLWSRRFFAHTTLPVKCPCSLTSKLAVCMVA